MSYLNTTKDKDDEKEHGILAAILVATIPSITVVLIQKVVDIVAEKYFPSKKDEDEEEEENENNSNSKKPSDTKITKTK